MLVLVDDREKLPYHFKESRVAHLPHGDYSIAGVAPFSVTIERKSLADIYGCIGQSRARFVRELEQLARYKYAAVVIESDLPSFLQPPPFTHIHPNSAIGSIIRWSIKYRLPIWFGGDRRHSQALTRKLLEKYWDGVDEQ